MNVVFGGGRGGDRSCFGAEVAEQLGPLLQPLRCQVVVEPEVANAKIVGVRIGLEHEWVVFGAKTAAELAWCDVDLAVAMRFGRDDIGRDRAAVAVALGKPADERAKARIIGWAGVD